MPKSSDGVEESYPYIVTTDKEGNVKTNKRENDSAGAIIAANRVFSWAASEDGDERIPSNPIQKMKRPEYKPPRCVFNGR